MCNAPRRMEASRYGDKVLLGNWNEDLFGRQLSIKEFIRKSANEELVMQKIQKLFTIMLRDVELEAPKSYLRFGAIIQLVAPLMPSSPGTTTEMALSISTDGTLLLKCQQVTGECHLTLAPAETSCVRNSFMVVSADKHDRTDETLTYNQDFYLQTVESEGGRLILYSSPKTFDLRNVSSCPHTFYKNGEINQSVGLCLTESKNCSEKSLIPPLHCRWRCLHIFPNERFDTEGYPVPCNTKVVIAHSATNKLLAGEDGWINTFFGKELGVSVTTYLDTHKIQTYQNCWTFRTKEAE